MLFDGARQCSTDQTLHREMIIRILVSLSKVNHNPFYFSVGCGKDNLGSLRVDWYYQSRNIREKHCFQRNILTSLWFSYILTSDTLIRLTIKSFKVKTWSLSTSNRFRQPFIYTVFASIKPFSLTFHMFCQFWSKEMFVVNHKCDLS